MTAIVCPGCRQPAEPGDIECSLCGRDLGSAGARTAQEQPPPRAGTAEPSPFPPQGAPHEAPASWAPGGGPPGGWGGEPVRYQQGRGPPVEPRRSPARIIIALAVALLVVAAGAAGFLRHSGGSTASASTTSPSTPATHTGPTSPRHRRRAPVRVLAALDRGRLEHGVQRIPGGDDHGT